ncbi:RNA 2',3'-cyclic phosphodiesterase [Prolixibacteraceae bacterium Z1-6]|uniref:RNA 2',3'-cyclic phosphodiesterase n=1 Tax=Draconibacterium aestuarii TaxID=2998507 RepID=A0A9X3F1F7_9BACT|nr:RNA 2',3'-cyclic phosphodiesterase [Prolixibacteraceae bacterium Z1-6]
MQSEIRTFIAVKIRPEQKLLKLLKDFKSVFAGESIKWVDEDNLHLTLRFLGNTTRQQLYELVDRLQVVAELTDSFQLKIKGAGYFKSKGQPRVVFVRIIDSDSLSELVAGIEQNAVAIGFQDELKAFRPHLTLGRIKHLENKNRFYSKMEKLESIDFQKVDVTEFILYQSILRPEGPVYRVIKKFELK